MRRPPLLLAVLAALLAACGDDGPSGLQGPRPVPGDIDRDGFAPPEDCFDGPFAWAKAGPLCDGSSWLRFVPGDGAGANDFALAEHGGRLHIVHIRNPGTWWTPGRAIDFGHEDTADLQTWQRHPPIELRGPAGTWNDRNVWAPHLVRAGRRWAMFYTGVTYTDDPALNRQRIGLAFTRDLRTFTPAASTCPGVTGEGCVLDGSAAWTAWSSGEPWTGDCRDPFVAAAGDGWVMLATVRLARADQPLAIARAWSADLLDWSWVDVIEATVGPLAESPALLPAAGGQLLLWTAERGQRWAWAPDALGEFLPGGPAPGGHASEALPLADGSFLFGSVQSFAVQLGRLEIVASPATKMRGAARTAAGDAPPALALRLHPCVAPACRVPGASIHPGPSDPRNGLDDNCDGLVDAVRPPIPPPHPRGREPRGRLPALEPIAQRW